ncbi:hypothetical protein MHM83_01840 [Tenacibaculum sp. Mcav3-52]|uniref:hypothetical protein n=1 Tax=Tenacibaculum sp. Mcav3-52 TaxID=2917762 RepID=UPI001EF36CC3|nr:hypothetical protein [Tenacibaculum sp. Mcav3-52]MCG7500603.1 hypothetical protein [Tenacibaculum sp. Mcav3-52]
MEQNKSSIDLPKSITDSAKLIYVSALFGIINPIIVELTTKIKNFSNPINLAIILISTGVLVLFAYNINKGKNWARIIFTVLCGLGLLMSPFVISDSFKLNPIIGVLSLAQAILQILAVVLMFKRDSRKWYRMKK